MRALLIDDSRAQRCVERGMLNGFGFEVIEAADGKEAMAKLPATEGFDLVVVDWNMPEMNGLDFIKAARATPAGRDVPILMATTETEMGQVALALLAGANEYVMKPFGKDMLHDKLVILGLVS